jgi:hypothetical protein
MALWKKTICWVSIWPKMFRVTFYFGPKNRDEIKNASLDKDLKKEFVAGKGQGKLRPLRIEVTDRSRLKEINELVVLKERLK